MADFTANMTGTVAVDDSIREEFETEFIVEYTQNNVMDQFVQYNKQIGAKSISMPRYAALSVSETPLVETEDVASQALSDTEILFTPAEYGTSATITKLAELQTGGMVARAAVRQVANNMGRARNIHATRALEGTANVLFGGVATSEATVAVGEDMTPVLLNQVYNKMARANVPLMAGGLYIAFLHDDVIASLRATSAAGSWEDVSKYTDAMPALKNEIGIYKGFRIVRNNEQTVGADTGAAGIDVYTSSFLGENGLGLAESKVPSLVATGPYDKLDRFVNIGWHGVYQYGIVESTAVFKTMTASAFEVE